MKPVFGVRFRTTVNGNFSGSEHLNIEAEDADSAIEIGRGLAYENLVARRKKAYNRFDGGDGVPLPITINDDVKVKLVSITPYDLPKVDNA